MFAEWLLASLLFFFPELTFTYFLGLSLSHTHEDFYGIHLQADLVVSPLY